MRLPLRTGVISIFVAAFLGFGPAAQARVQKFPVTSVRHGQAVFVVHGVKAKSVTGVSIVTKRGAGQRPARRSLRLAKARRAIRRGGLHVPVRELGAPVASAGGSGGSEVVAAETSAVVRSTTPPETTITAGPEETVTTSSVTFRFKSSKRHSTFQCSLDGVTAACSSPCVYSGLSDGSHTFSVVATDRAGNVDPTPATRTFTVQLPSLPPSNHPSGETPAAGETPASGETPALGETPASSETQAGSRCEAAPVAPHSWPAGCWRPYGEASPFNHLLPAEPQLAPNSSAIVNQLMSWGKAQGLIVGQPAGNDEDYGHPVYYASPEDPLYTIHCTMWTSGCPIEGMQVHIPAAARPASGTDAHMVVIDQQNGWEYDFWQVHTQPLPAAGGTIDISYGGRTRWGSTPDATGLGSDATAAGFGLEAGVIRAEEWGSATAEGGAINHALFMSVRCTGGYSVYPAAPGTTALACPNSEKADAPPLGTHFYLDMSDAQIDALPVPEWKRPILKAMAHYGLFVGDTFGGSSNSFGLSAESDTQYRSMGLPGRYAELGKKWGVGTYNGAYVFDIASGVEWARYLKVVEPCVAQQSC